MKWNQTAPCASCPYRKDVPTGIWDMSQYEMLLENDHAQGGVFLCHLSEKGTSNEHFCVGWLLDQKRRNTPNLALRMKLITSYAARQLYKHISAGGAVLYETIGEMVEANMGKAFPVNHPIARKLKKRETERNARAAEK